MRAVRSLVLHPSGRAVAATAVVWAALAALLFGGAGRFSLAAVEAACGRPAPDVTLAPTRAALRAFTTACGPTGLAAYRDLQLVDLLYPAALALTLGGVLLLAAARLPQRTGRRVRALALLPWLAAAGDYLENAAAWTFLHLDGAVPGGAAAAYRTGSTVKNAASWAAWLAVLGVLGWLGARAARSSSRSRRTAATSSAASGPASGTPAGVPR